MYIAIYNRYSTYSSIILSEIFAFDIRIVSELTATEASIQYFLL